MSGWPKALESEGKEIEAALRNMWTTERHEQHAAAARAALVERVRGMLMEAARRGAHGADVYGLTGEIADALLSEPPAQEGE